MMNSMSMGTGNNLFLKQEKMKATKLIINWEVQNLCDCSNKWVVIPVVSDLPANPVEWQMVIDSSDDCLKIYYDWAWFTIIPLVMQQNT